MDFGDSAAAAEPATILPLGFGGLVTANFHSLHLSLHVDDELGQLVLAGSRHVKWVVRPNVQVQLAQQAPRSENSGSPDSLTEREVLDVPSGCQHCLLQLFFVACLLDVGSVIRIRAAAGVHVAGKGAYQDLVEGRRSLHDFLDTSEGRLLQFLSGEDRVAVNVIGAPNTPFGSWDEAPLLRFCKEKAKTRINE